MRVIWHFFFGDDKWCVPSEEKLPLAHYRPEIADCLLAKINM